MCYGTMEAVRAGSVCIVDVLEVFMLLLCSCISIPHTPLQAETGRHVLHALTTRTPQLYVRVDSGIGVNIVIT